MSEEALPEADRIDGAPHPRETVQLFGQDAAEQQVLDALNADRFHHAWLLTGPRGVGKATLAWRMARHLLTAPPKGDAGLFGGGPAPATSLDVAPDHPVVRRIAAQSEPRLLHIRRSWNADTKKLRAQIIVDDVRRLNGFFGLSATDGGRRVVIVDSADEMNVSAANALLKVLEEPPRDAVLILISHHPARLLPTIRSRCREVRLSALSAQSVAQALAQAGIPLENAEALAELSSGSAGDAIALINGDGLALYSDILKLLDTCPNIDRQILLKLTEKSGARGADVRLEMTLRLLDLAIARMARLGTGLAPKAEAAPGEFDSLARLAPDATAAQKWARLQHDLSQEAAHARAVNIDPQSLLLSLFLKVNDAA